MLEPMRSAVIGARAGVNRRRECRAAIILLLLLGIANFDVTCRCWGDERPNIILINLDDADQAMFSDFVLGARFPTLDRLRQEGLRFNNCHVTTPLCGPSRACLFRGQYASNLGILVNNDRSVIGQGFDGGFQVYLENGYFADDLGTRMVSAGYRTMMVGKYLHGEYSREIPIGWQDFRHSASTKYHETFRVIARDGEILRTGQIGQGQYRTNVEGGDIVDLLLAHIDRSPGIREPFFLYWAPIAPHTGAGDDPVADMIDHERYGNLWSGIRLPRPNDLNESDVSDKHPVTSSLDVIADHRLDNSITDFYRARMVSMRSVDDMIAGIMDVLALIEEIDNTYIVVCSDNGFQLGHHRLIGKKAPFDRNSNVPLICWGPGIPAGASADHLLAHIDLMPTILELAGAEVPAYVDGKSFAPLLLDPTGNDEQRWQQAVLIQNWEHLSTGMTTPNLPTTYSSLRLYDSVYTEWADGFREYYDLGRDPLQLRNRVDRLAADELGLMHEMLTNWNLQDHDGAVVQLSPTQGELAVSHGLTLSGVASADSQIQAVRLIIQHDQDGTYWNGLGWQPQRTVVRASLDNVGLQSTWSYRIANTLVEDGQWPVTVTAKVVDGDGDVSSVREPIGFLIDGRPPTTEVLSPDSGSVHSGAVRIRGRVSDDMPIERLTLIIRHAVNGKYWNGQAMQAERIAIEVPLDERGRFVYRFPARHGRFRIFARAVDVSGNVEAAGEAIDFQIRLGN